VRLKLGDGEEQDSLEDLSLDSGKGEGGGSRLSWDRSREGSDHDGSSLGLPVGINNSTLSSSDVVVVPVPRLGAARGEDRRSCLNP
jgi:hypothetical protein